MNSRHPRMLRPVLPVRRATERQLWTAALVYLALAVLPAAIVVALVLGLHAIGLGGAP